MNQLTEQEDLANLIRNYVHYDNLVINLQKQTQNSRIVRDDFENRIIKQLRDNKMENAIIQIVGGKLKIVEEKHTNPLSFKSIEDSLHQYYFNKKVSDDTSNVIKFIKESRKFETNYKLKKIPQLPPQPALVQEPLQQQQQQQKQQQQMQQQQKQQQQLQQKPIQQPLNNVYKANGLK